MGQAPRIAQHPPRPETLNPKPKTLTPSKQLPQMLELVDGAGTLEVRWGIGLRVLNIFGLTLNLKA